MTIHRAKGLEFPVVCVADLGRKAGGARSPLLVGARRHRRPAARPARRRRHDPDDHVDRARRRGRRSRRRGGAPPLLRRDDARPGAADPVRRRPTWAAGRPRARAARRSTGSPARVGRRAGGRESAAPARRSIAARARDGRRARASARRRASTRPRRSARSSTRRARSRGRAPAPTQSTTALPAKPAFVPPAPARARPAPQRLSYSQLTDYAKCGYRFYLSRVLGLPDVTPPPPEVEPEVVAGIDPRTRGSIVHRALEEIDFDAPAAPDRGRDPGLRRRRRASRSPTRRSRTSRPSCRRSPTHRCASA